MSGPREGLTEAIRSVTDLWDEPLDEVHDVPQIVNAILVSGWLAEHDRGVAEQAWDEGYDAGGLQRNPYRPDST